MDYSMICRCCLEEFSRENPMCGNERIMEMYLFCIQLNFKIFQGEDVPKYFCLKCRDQLKSAYIFIRYAKHCNAKLEKTILQNRVMKTPNIVNANTESCGSNGGLNTDLYDDSQDLPHQGDEEPKHGIHDDYQRLIAEEENHENCTSPVSSIHCSSKHKNKAEEVKNEDETQIIPKIEKCNSNASYINISIPLEKQQSKSWIIATEPRKRVYSKSNRTTKKQWRDKQLSCKKSKEQHIDSRTVDKPFICGHREKSYKSKQTLLKHIIEEKEDSLFICDVCQKRFTKRPYLIDHLASHSDLKPFKCNLCSKTFKRRKALWTHTQVHKIQQTGEKPYMCDVCNKQFTTLSNLKVHSDIHAGQRPRPFTCNLCDKLFLNKHQLMRHVDTHSINYQALCTICGKGFRCERYLTEHMQVHTGVKSFACGLCNYRAAYISNLRRHELTHTNKRQHQCPHCQKKFNGRDGLARHIRTHTGEKPIKCPSCPVSFIDHWKRKSHLMRVHKVPFNEIPRLSADGQPIFN